MKSKEIKELFNKFEQIACEYEGVECWSARELAVLLGYNKWEKFLNVIDKAKDACDNAGELSENHFPRVGKMVLCIRYVGILTNVCTLFILRRGIHGKMEFREK